MIVDDIKVINRFMHFSGVTCESFDAWRRIKEVLGIVLAQQHLTQAKAAEALPEGEICPHARLKWAVYDCTIKDRFALDFRDCNGKGTYSVSGGVHSFGYSHQCNKINDATNVMHDTLSYEKRSEYACNVCGSIPDENECIEHDKGCYTQDENGGGISFVDFN